MLLTTDRHLRDIDTSERSSFWRQLRTDSVWGCRQLPRTFVLAAVTHRFGTWLPPVRIGGGRRGGVRVAGGGRRARPSRHRRRGARATSRGRTTGPTPFAALHRRGA